MYDVRIGQRNWQEYTPFGEARMNSHTEVWIHDTYRHLTYKEVLVALAGKKKKKSEIRNSLTPLELPNPSL